MPLFRFTSTAPTALTRFDVRCRVNARWDISHYRTRRYNAKEILTGYALIHELFIYNLPGTTLPHAYKIEVQSEIASPAPYTLSVATYTHRNIPEDMPEGYTEVPRHILPLVPNDATRVYINRETYSIVVHTNTWRDALARYIGAQFITLLLSRAITISGEQFEILENDDEVAIAELYATDIAVQINEIRDAAQREADERRENEEREQAARREQEYLENITNLFRQDEYELKNKIEHATSRVDTYKRHLEDALAQLEAARKEYYTAIILGEAADTAVQNLKQFITNCNWVRVVRCENDILEVLITTKMEYWDKQTAERYLGRRASRWINVLKKVFVTEEYELLMSNIVIIRVNDLRITDISKEKNALIPNMRNPHHAEYNCWGQYTATITDLIRTHRFEELFMTIRTAIAGINFADGAVASKLVENYCNIEKPCILVKETGEILTPTEAMEKEVL